MANNLVTNPIHLTTAGATSAITTRMQIKAIVWWDNAGTAGDDLEIHDEAGGNLIFAAVASTAKYTVTFRHPIFAKGLYLTTLDSGEVLIYV